MAKTISYCFAALSLVSRLEGSPLEELSYQLGIAHSWVNKYPAFICKAPEPFDVIDVPVFIHYESRPLAPPRSEELGSAILKSIVRDSRIYTIGSEYKPLFEDGQIYPDDKCLVFHKGTGFRVPVDTYNEVKYPFAVLTFPMKDSDFSPELESIAVAPGANDESSHFNLFPSSATMERHIKTGVFNLPDGARTPNITTEGDSWHFTVTQLGLIRDQKYTQLNKASDVHMKGYVSSSSKGLSFSSIYYDQILSELNSTLGDRLSKSVDGPYIISNCYTDVPDGAYRVRVEEFPEVAVFLDGLGGNAIRFTANTFMESTGSGDKTCWLHIKKDETLSENEMVIGDALFRAVELEFSKAEGFVINPLKVYSPIHTMEELSPFNPRLGSVVPEGASTPEPAVFVNRYDGVESAGNGLLIGIVVGGCVLILGAIAFLVIRAKRKARHDRFSAERPMVGDPSMSSAISN